MSLEQPYKDVIDLTPKTLPPKPVENAAAKPPLPKNQTPQVPQPQDSYSSLSSDESETPTKQQSSSSSEDAESVIVVASPDLDKKEEVAEKPPVPRQKRPAPLPPIEREAKPEPKPRSRGVDPAELERRLSQELIASTIANKISEYDPDLEDAPLSIVPPAEFEDVDEERPEARIETPSPASYHSSADSSTTYTQEQPSDELQRPQILELTDDLVLDSEREELPKERPPQAARRSLLGDLPPLQQPVHPTPAQRRQSAPTASRVVEFSEPLHSSIPRLLKTNFQKINFSSFSKRDIKFCRQHK